MPRTVPALPAARAKHGSVPALARVPTNTFLCAARREVLVNTASTSLRVREPGRTRFSACCTACNNVQGIPFLVPILLSELVCD
eukprot:NODE_33389_length_296_cov_37.165680.p2 GENE.NODE_33389_length_296_cov_37.165680~~NODE_33389_length_296_cov_37.165680.p2  ORF type:complete len:95 (+),score=8.51 NODE_33389_length_296_cov_37.165680:34-285(+)